VHPRASTANLKSGARDCAGESTVIDKNSAYGRNFWSILRTVRPCLKLRHIVDEGPSRLDSETSRGNAHNRRRTMVENGFLLRRNPTFAGGLRREHVPEAGTQRGAGSTVRSMLSSSG
jgi:hypothetical protein